MNVSWWGRLPDGTFATAAEVHYPPLFVDQLTNLGAQPLASALGETELTLNLSSQVATGKQPSSKKIPVPEFSQVIRVTGLAAALPTV